MATVYNQALAHRFGVALSQLLESGDWRMIQAAVAWVRRSGTKHLLPAFQAFLGSGGKARFTVGVDIENTSKEGLEDLLALGDVGDSVTYVHHNESPDVTFHPKVYLLTNDVRARLIIGSNNLTQSGLFTNTEVGLQIDASPNDQVILDIQKALHAWSDTSENLARELDQDLLEALVREGYVFPERLLQSRRASSSAGRRRRPGQTASQVLFGKRTVTAPAAPQRHTPGTGGAGRRSRRGPRAAKSAPVQPTNALLMRVRISPRRQKQVQIPLPLVRSSFFSGITSITSGHDGTARVMSATHPKRAKGGVNTVKVEMPETLGMADPVVRLDKSAAGIVYYAYDSSSTQGQPIMDSLNAGRLDTPPTTILTKPSDPDHSQWYRFI